MNAITVIFALCVFFVGRRLIQLRRGSGLHLNPKAETVPHGSLPQGLFELEARLADELAALGFSPARVQACPNYGRYAYAAVEWHQIVYTSPDTPLMILLVTEGEVWQVILTAHRTDGSNPARFLKPGDLQQHGLSDWVARTDLAEQSPVPTRRVAESDWDVWLADSMQELVDSYVAAGFLLRTRDPDWGRWPWRAIVRAYWDEFRLGAFRGYQPVPRVERGFPVVLKDKPTAPGPASD